jgi:hypothetical protein
VKPLKDQLPDLMEVYLRAREDYDRLQNAD